jgi:Predicted membrane protein
MRSTASFDLGEILLERIMVPGIVALTLALAIYAGLMLLLRRRMDRQAAHFVASIGAVPTGLATLITLTGYGEAVWFLWIFPIVVGLITLAVLLFVKREEGPAEPRRRRSRPKAVRDAEVEAFRRGNEGEAVVRNHVAKLGLPSLHDIYVPHDNGATQVDHAVLAGGAIVVIETKNYSGAIYGTAEQRQWTQVLAGGRNRSRFQNPLEQNRGHQKAVRKFCGGEVRVVTLFVGNATFPKGRPEGVFSLADVGKELRRIAAEVPASPARAEAWLKLSVLADSNRDKGLRAAHLETVRAAKDRNDRLRPDGGTPAKPQGGDIIRLGPRDRI